MAKISDLKLAYQLFMKAYPYRTVDWTPGARLCKPLREARVAVVTTAAFFRPDQPPFDTSMRGGDYSYRAIPAGTRPRAPWASPTAATLSTIAASRRTGISHCPWTGSKHMTEEGVLGPPAPRHFSFMGSMAAPGRLIAQTAPEVAEMLLEDEVDAVFLTPV